MIAVAIFLFSSGILATRLPSNGTPGFYEAGRNAEGNGHPLKGLERNDGKLLVSNIDRILPEFRS
jgi:hypothetical protein